MLREEPEAADLLATAREVLLNDLLPALPPDKAFAARMVANAMAIAGRAAAQDAWETATLARIATLAADPRAFAAAIRPELGAPMADLMWTVLNTARSKDVAMDALEELLRSAERKSGAEWTRPGLAVLLPRLVTEEHDRRRLDWLLRRMMNDPEKPLPESKARDLWWLAVEPEGRPRQAGPRRVRTREEERYG